MRAGRVIHTFGRATERLRPPMSLTCQAQRLVAWSACCGVARGRLWWGRRSARCADSGAAGQHPVEQVSQRAGCPSPRARPLRWHCRIKQSAGDAAANLPVERREGVHGAVSTGKGGRLQARGIRLSGPPASSDRKSSRVAVGRCLNATVPSRSMQECPVVLTTDVPGAMQISVNRR